MQGDDEIVVETAFRTFLVRVDRFRQTPLTDAQREDGQRLALDLRFELGFDPDLQVAAQRLAHALIGTGPVRLRRLDAKIETQRFFEQLGEFLEEQLETGRLIVLDEPAIANVPEQELTVRRPRLDPKPPAELIPRREAPLQTSFEVRFVDEIGQAISALEVQIAAGDRVERVTTNAAGVALLEGTTAGSGTVTVLDPAALEKILEPRWAKKRIGSPPNGLNRTEQVFDGRGLDATTIKGGVPNIVVIKPKLGKLFAELWDKSGRVRHAKRDYTISGPASLKGTTDADGRLLHENVQNGDYTLAFDLDEGESVEAALVARATDRDAAQVRFLGAIPRVALARLKGLFFDTNKSFLLPATMSVFDRFRDVYLANNPGELLIVGHADTTGEPAINDPLSLERANNTAAFILDDVDSWLKMYDAGLPSVRRWGSNEDELMMLALPDSDGKPENEAPLHWFQRTRGLQVDGAAGPKTRRQLISEYMALDDASLNDPEFDIQITTHGCGENFPLDASGEELDSAPANDTDDQTDRRVELFFFDPEFGIQPPPPGDNSPPGSSQYPEWRRKAQISHDVDASGAELQVLLQDPNGQPLPDTRVQVLQDGVVIRTRTSDNAGKISITGHDPTRPCELVVIGQSPLVIDGGRDEDPDLALDAEEQSSSDALDGCQVELADVAPFEPPDLDGDSVLV